MIVPGGKVNVVFLKQLKATIARFVKRGDRFVIVTGGGGTCRAYQAALKKIGRVSPTELDQLGIGVTRLNAELVRLMFGKMAHPELVEGDPTGFNPRSWKRPVLVGGGFKPGRSSDDKAVLFAKRLKADVVINVSNIDYLYTKDPRTHKDAEIICEILWKDYRKISGSVWRPGMSIPFDPVASRRADAAGIDVILVGPDMKNLSDVLSERPFRGTVIH